MSLRSGEQGQRLMDPHFTTQANRSGALKSRRQNMIVLTAILALFGACFLDPYDCNFGGMKLGIQSNGASTVLSADFILVFEMVK